MRARRMPAAFCSPPTPSFPQNTTQPQPSLASTQPPRPAGGGGAPSTRASPTTSPLAGAAAELAAWRAHAAAALDAVDVNVRALREDVAAELGSVRRLLARARAAREARVRGCGLAAGWAHKS
jgi:hypothetical protein